jgi:hypothetical protein
MSRARSQAAASGSGRAAAGVEIGVKLLRQINEDVKAIAYYDGEVFIAPREGPISVLDFATAQPLCATFFYCVLLVSVL